jgi:hypothetical protein
MSILAALMLLQTACPASAEPVPPALAGWTAGPPMAAAAEPVSAPVAPIGEPVEVALRSAADFKPAVSATRAAAADSHGGLVAIDVGRAGRYRVVLSNASWVEIVSKGSAIASTGHGHGPRCSGMRKIVDFDLPAGRHLIQLTGSPDATVRLMVVPAA